MQKEEGKPTYEELLEEVEMLRKVNSDWEHDYNSLLKRYNETLASRYRKSSEAVDKDQLSLFDEAELAVCDGAFNDDEGKDDSLVDFSQ